MKKNIRNKKYYFLGLVLFFYGILVIPLMVFNSQTKQDPRGKAQTVTPTTTQATCGNAPTDTVIIIDRSGSMQPANKITPTKNAAKNFINVISQDNRNRVSVVSFSTKGTMDLPLTTDYAAARGKVDAIQADGWTCVECAIKLANQEIAANGRAGVKKVVVLLTDGQANYVDGTNSQVSTTLADQRALTAAQNGFNTSKTQFFTIGLGDPNASGNERFFNPDLLKKVAEATGGKFYFPLPNELNNVYNDISLLIGKATVGGYVFQDANGNGVFDSNETKVPNWSLTLTSPTWGVKSVTTDSTGNYLFSSVCDGTYSLKLVPQSGWVQSFPADPNGHSFTIQNGFSVVDKNFGVKVGSRCSDIVDNDNNGFADSKDSTCHTDGNPNNPASYDPNKDGERGGNTCADSKDNNGNGLIDGADPVCHPNGDPTKPWDPNLPEVNPTAVPTATTTNLSLTLFFDGIGNRGDNTNPNESSLSNKNPLHPIIKSDVQIFNSNNQLVSTAAGVVTYNPASGNFKGNLALSSDILSGGQYTIKVKAARYLRKIVPGIQTIKTGQANEINPVALVAGDIKDDNRLDILDYNLLLDCYSDLKAAANCPTPEKKVVADVNDDGFVNQVDYNLFLREISTQPGQ